MQRQIAARKELDCRGKVEAVDTGWVLKMSGVDGRRLCRNRRNNCLDRVSMLSFWEIQPIYRPGEVLEDSPKTNKIGKNDYVGKKT